MHEEGALDGQLMEDKACLHLIRKNAYSLISSCNRNFWPPMMLQGQMPDCAFTPW